MSEQRPSTGTGDIVGTVLNFKYQVVKRLSQGGMGVVYKARHLMLDAPVALKVLLKPESEEAQQRFLSEARLASKVRHPNTVYIADFGVFDDGRAFLEMEFLDGRTLGAELAKGPIEPARACAIAMQIARGLQAVHDKGIVHRDMKPDNVFLLEQDGTPDFVKIVDFGIAKSTQRNSPSGPRPAMAAAKDLADLKSSGAFGNFTQAGMVMGTPGFMAPEQLQGWPVDVRVDQYALGCILYEMIAGQAVFAEKDQQKLMVKHIASPPMSLRQRCPNVKVSKRLDALVLRLLAKDPKARFASMREVEQALEDTLDRSLPGVRRPTGTYALAGARRLELLGLAIPVWAVAAVSACGLALALGYGSYRWLAHRPSVQASEDLQPGEMSALRQRAIALLRQDARDDAGELRASALAALGQSGDGELLADLQAALARSEPATRAEAAAAMGSLGDRRAVAPLSGLLQGARPPAGPPVPAEPLSVKVAAADALRQLGDPRGARFLTQTLEGQDQEAQLRAALLFCAQGPADAQRVLQAYLQRSGLPAATLLNILACVARAGQATAIERLRSQVNEVGPPEPRLLAAVKLAQLGDGDGLKYLREVLHKRERDHVVAARELALLDEPEGLPLLRQLVESRGAASLARQLACDGLGALGEPPDARRLAGLLAQSGDRPLAQAAARALVQISGRDPALQSMRSLSWAQSLVGDGDALVRQSAAAILGDNLNGGAVPLLAGLLKDQDARVRRSAALALGRRRDDGAVRALRDALQDSDRTVRLEALRALLHVGDFLRAPAVAQAVGSLRDTLLEMLSQAPEPADSAERLLATSVLLRLGDSSQLKPLRAWLAASDGELRRLAVEQLPLSADELAGMLADKSSEVRSLVARKLAELGDRRAAPALRELVGRGGAAAVAAYALLLRLGESVGEADPLVALLADSSPSRRSEAIEALRQRPPAQALPFLSQAARDREVQVRWTVAAVAADLAEQPGGERAAAILRRLTTDSDPMVRARAEALLARRQRPSATATAPVPSASGRGSPAARTGTPPAQPDSPPDAGSTPVVDAKGGGAAPVHGPAPGKDAAASPLHPAPSASAGSEDDLSAQSEKLIRTGMDAFEHKDNKKAQRLLAKALALCSREHKRGNCTAYALEIHYRLGQIQEQQKSWPEAMTEYQQVLALAPQVRTNASIKGDVQEAVQRLTPRLGQVVVARPGKHGCAHETIWMRPGSHSIRLDGKFEQIEVKAGEVVPVGSCK